MSRELFDLEAAHEVLEVWEGDATEAGAIEGDHDLPANLDAGAALDVIWKKRSSF